MGGGGFEEKEEGNLKLVEDGPATFQRPIRKGVFVEHVKA